MRITPKDGSTQITLDPKQVHVILHPQGNTIETCGYKINISSNTNTESARDKLSYLISSFGHLERFLETPEEADEYIDEEYDLHMCNNSIAWYSNNTSRERIIAAYIASKDISPIITTENSEDIFSQDVSQIFRAYHISDRLYRRTYKVAKLIYSRCGVVSLINKYLVGEYPKINSINIKHKTHSHSLIISILNFYGGVRHVSGCIDLDITNGIAVKKKDINFLMSGNAINDAILFKAIERHCQLNSDSTSIRLLLDSLSSGNTVNQLHLRITGAAGVIGYMHSLGAAYNSMPKAFRNTVPDEGYEIEKLILANRTVRKSDIIMEVDKKIKAMLEGE